MGVKRFGQGLTPRGRVIARSKKAPHPPRANTASLSKKDICLYKDTIPHSGGLFQPQVKILDRFALTIYPYALEGHFCTSLSPRRFAFAVKDAEISFDFLVPGFVIVPTVL